MTQQHLNHHIYQEKMDALYLISIAKECKCFFFFFLLDYLKIYLHAYNEFKSFSVYYLNISVAVQKRTI